MAVNKMLKQIELFGIKISKMNMRETLSYLMNAVEQRTPTQVITANPIMIMAALEDEIYKNMMQQAELIVPDGAGIVWAANVLRNPVQERVPGIDLMIELLGAAQEKQWKVYFLGASQEVIEAAVERLRNQFPNLNICGYRNGYFGPAEDAAVIAELKAQAPDLLFVGRAANQQEPWIHQHKLNLHIPIMMGVGGSYDVLSGKLKRAPFIWQKMRLEWLYRLLQEPWRYKRMVQLPKFMWRVYRNK
jgi:N-acetylglucosaminyldiphosphoundecaprenol N-acetyl-beta-D-mannosaminyltransferase